MNSSVTSTLPGRQTRLRSLRLKVHDHQKLALVLFRQLELPAQRLVFFRRLSALARTLDGTCFHHAVAQAQEALRRGADDLVIAAVKIAAEGRGIVRAQMLKRPRVARGRS